MSKMDAILPISCDDINRSKILFHSLNMFFETASLGTVYLIVPEAQPMEELLSQITLKFKTKVLTDAEVIPQREWRRYNKKKGWIKQQILKLVSAKYINTDFYICFDADIICIRPVCYSDIIMENRPIANIEPKSLHKKWWNRSRKILKAPKNENTQGLGVTPSILITKEVLNLIQHIENIYDRPFVEVLCSKKHWTEYTLYWAFLESLKKEDLYNHENIIYGESIWHSSTLNQSLFDTVFSEKNRGFFIICQSRTISDKEAYKLSKRILGEWSF